MKRSRPETWTSGARAPYMERIAYVHDVAPMPIKPNCDRRDSLEGFIDKALAASALGTSPLSQGRNIKPLPPSLAPLPMPKGPPNGFLENADFGQRHAEGYGPVLAPACGAFDEFSTSAISQQSSHVSTEKETIDRVKAEIDEILSPVSECGDRATNCFRHLQTMNPILHVPPLVTAPPVPKPSDIHPELPSMSGKGRAMQEILQAMAAPTKRSSNGRKSTSTSSTRCQLCGKTYTESSNLSKHIRTVHLKLRPFRCHLCSSSFAEKNKLGKHIQSVHEHARPYKCDLCSATFSQASDRKRHRLVLHEGCRPFVCEHCGKAFGRRSSLTQHCQRVHKTGTKVPRVQPPPVIVQHPIGGGMASVPATEVFASSQMPMGSHPL